MKRDRRVKGTKDISVLLEKVPRRLIEDARAKCKAESPSITLKGKILNLLTGWTYSA